MVDATRVLILGGSWFLGRTIAESAVALGAEVTTFRRGVSGTDADGVTVFYGDRTDPADIARLASAGTWDAVIDTSSYVPRETLQLARALEPVVERYVLVSTVAVYSGWPLKPLTESSDVLECPADAGPDFSHAGDPRPSQYSITKAGCERAVTETFGPERTAILRPGVILGPLEYVGRLEWWLRRMQRGGRVLGPGCPSRSIQPVDVRDVAEFALHACTSSGTWNVTASGIDTMGDLLEACNRVAADGEARIEWVTDEDWLQAHGVSQWKELPLWRTHRGTWAVDSQRARVEGLICRPLSDTVSDTWEWLTCGGAPIAHVRAGELGLCPDREQAVLRAWDAHQLERRGA
ncbi:NAD-dependent epimerase/dehydratase family protein [Nocardia sp. NPDC058497]|uniref:NAD-dependent epimerase/dehydratase family protein n=1 Tax=Nocardia sp. NPDC058497 TaxID=3346529 RepID=UPI0036654B45